jgi:hypothetical protein
LSAAAFAGAPAADDHPDRPVERHLGSVAYVTGGIGKTDRATLRRMGGAYPLHIVLSAARDDELVADVPVEITDARGRQVFRLDKADPLLDVRLPEGKYVVSARFDGVRKAQAVVLADKGPQTVYFHWKAPEGA